MLKGLVNKIPEGFELEFRSVDDDGYWIRATYADVTASQEELVEFLGKLRQAVAETNFDTSSAVVG